MDKINTLYLVDDDKSFQFLTREIIEPTKLVDHIQVFSNGLEAITYLKNVKAPDDLPEVLLLDLNMPIMNGWEFLEEYTQLKPALSKNIAIYIVSSSVSPSDLQKARSFSSVADYVIKPLTESQLAEIIHKL